MISKILIVDDQETVIGGTIAPLKQQYPDAEIVTAQTGKKAIDLVERHQPELLVMDLSLPFEPGEQAVSEVGIQVLRTVMEKFKTLNIVVHSIDPMPLVRLRPAIDSHEGGFTVVNKAMSIQDMTTRVDWALQGLNYTPREIRTGVEVRPEWLEVLNLAFNQALTDKAIAEFMNVSERTVRNYWSKMQDALGVYPEQGKNIRVQTGKRAREEGLID
ncbi:response regulator receiver protein [Thalassoporum mexicanum PCC 7367]|uniref:response regulator transcription factor n=1 Tax=Thalassoporum mexicanum TaxID=3457544 RepID=UPI00029FC937|nr:response regulator transcription factor [Pseudanabaena sp. PCC 7367]AFY68727.1 response regulator receiver protein [Pseudanabaena sp. PCC 7367]